MSGPRRPPAATGLHRRVLIVDDNQAIHADVRKLFAPAGASSAEVDALENELFGASKPSPVSFQFDSALQGDRGLALVETALAEGRPYSVAFVDMRMPPGWDGLETISRVWKVDPSLQIVICTAYSDYGWAEITGRLGQTDNLLVLKKPFDAVEAVQMVHALSEKWRLRREVEDQVCELELRVRERTEALELSNALLRAESSERTRLSVGLRKAERMASLGALTAGIAHEINNPLAYALGNLAFVTEQLEQARRAPGADPRLLEVAEALRETIEGGERIKRIVADMRALARRDRDEPGVADAGLALETALRTVAAELEPRARVVSELIPLPAVAGDVERLAQVFVNLLQNAAHAIAPGAKDRNTIRLRSGSGPGGLVWVDVSDTGSGIAPEVLPRIFDPFFTTKPVGSGTGLGLSICHSILSEFGGRVEISRSVPGEGSTFRVWLCASGQAAPAGPA